MTKRVRHIRCTGPPLARGRSHAIFFSLANYLFGRKEQENVSVSVSLCVSVGVRESDMQSDYSGESQLAKSPDGATAIISVVSC